MPAAPRHPTPVSSPAGRTTSGGQLKSSDLWLAARGGHGRSAPAVKTSQVWYERRPSPVFGVGSACEARTCRPETTMTDEMVRLGRQHGAGYAAHRALKGYVGERGAAELVDLLRQARSVHVGRRSSAAAVGGEDHRRWRRGLRERAHLGFKRSQAREQARVGRGDAEVHGREALDHWLGMMRSLKRSLSGRCRGRGEVDRQCSRRRAGAETTAAWVATGAARAGQGAQARSRAPSRASRSPRQRDREPRRPRPQRAAKLRASHMKLCSLRPRKT